MGLGKTSHIDIIYLWIQQAMRRRRIEVNKFFGDRNPADEPTKPKSLPDFEGLLSPVNFVLGETWRRRRGRPLPKGGVSHSQHYARHAWCVIHMEHVCAQHGEALAYPTPLGSSDEIGRRALSSLHVCRLLYGGGL